MKVLLDMNLPPSLADSLMVRGHDAIHWSQVGSATATDDEILNWANAQGRVLITHDLDFGAILAATNQRSPSVLQIRTHDLHPDAYLPVLLAVLRQEEGTLARGALISVDEGASRVRILPINQ